MTFGFQNLFIFGKFSDFYCTSPERKQRTQFKGHNSPGAGSLRVAKMSQCHNLFLQHSRSALLPKDLRFEHGGTKFVSCPRRHLTSVSPCTLRLSSQIDEICLQKYLPISAKLLITNYVNKMLLIIINVN